MGEEFWLKNPSCLFYSTLLIPTANMRKNERLNCFTRFIIVITLILLLFNYAYWYLVFVIGIILVLIMYLRDEPEYYEEVKIAKPEPQRDLRNRILGRQGMNMLGYSARRGRKFRTKFNSYLQT